MLIILASWREGNSRYPLVNDHIAGWNIPIFNRKYIDSIRGPHFPASYIRLPECILFYVFYVVLPVRKDLGTLHPNCCFPNSDCILLGANCSYQGHVLCQYLFLIQIVEIQVRYHTGTLTLNPSPTLPQNGPAVNGR